MTADWAPGLSLACRALHMAALLTLFGTLLFHALAWPANQPRRADALARAAAWLAVTAGILWLAAESAVIAGADTPGGGLAALPTVLSETRFGTLLALRLGMLAGCVMLLSGAPSRARRIAALVLAALCIVSHAALGHAGAMGGALGAALAASQAVHYLAAAAWLGGLPVLWLALRHLPRTEAIGAAAAFRPVGAVSVVLIAATAVFQAWGLVGGIGGLVGTDYGRLALAKAGLFCLLLGFAAVNRYVLVPAGARRMLLTSVLLEAVVGLAVVYAAATLSSLPPSLHQQPVWPFAWRPSLLALEDPDLRGEVLLGFAIAVAGLGSFVFALLLRRVRWPGLVCAAALLALAAPHLNLLLVEAYPTSYQTSPTDFAASSITQGATLFAAHCAACHGAGAKGDGPLAAGLPVPPADLTAAHLADHDDGTLFWWIGHGIREPDGTVAMPGVLGAVTEDGVWSLIDYIHARNAGASAEGAGSWTHPIRAPAFQATCPNGATVATDDLQGRTVRVSAGDAPAEPADDPLLVTVRLARDDDGGADAPGFCMAHGAWDAYAIVAGVPADRLAGTEFLIDPAGWLRALHRPDDGGALLDQLARIRATPLSISGDTHAHHHH